MKKIVIGLMAGMVLMGLAVGSQARVTEKVEAMIAENTPLKVNDTDLWIQVGYPLLVGLQYDKYATGNLVLGGGAGSYLNGFSLDLSVKYLFLTGKFSPFIAAGPVLYYTDPNKNLFGIYGTAGLGYFFDSGLGLSLGVTFVRAITESAQPWSYPWVNDKLSQASAQFGFHWNY
ncbi:MAG: hypothetical protein AB1439_00870 [candidate division FCPU426 bacterium]